MKEARRAARELALLAMSQLSDRRGKMADISFEQLMQAATKALVADAKDTLETAAAELKRGNARVVDSETLATDLAGGRLMVEDAIALTQGAINRLATAIELPEFVQMSNQEAVQAFTLELLSTTTHHLPTIDTVLDEAMVAWQLKRLARIDRDILRLATAEIRYLDTPDRVAINEAVELAKRYSGEDGYRFINGVLRRVVTPSISPPNISPPNDGPVSASPPTA